MLDIALKEWAVVCDLLLEGRLAVLLRKGGDRRDRRGRGCSSWNTSGLRCSRHGRHQKPEMIKSPLQKRVQMLDEPRQNHAVWRR